MLTVLRSLPPRSCASITPRTSAWSAVLDGSTTSTAHTEPGRVSSWFIYFIYVDFNVEIIKVKLEWWFDIFLLKCLCLCRWTWEGTCCFLQEGFDSHREIWDVGWWSSNPFFHLHRWVCGGCSSVRSSLLCLLNYIIFSTLLKHDDIFDDVYFV